MSTFVDTTMNITVHGTGYVGLVTGACMADAGNHVICVDVDETKIRALNEGRITIYEPGLDDIVTRNVAAGRLTFTMDIPEAVRSSLFQFIAVALHPTRAARPMCNMCWTWLGQLHKQWMTTKSL